MAHPPRQGTVYGRAPVGRPQVAPPRRENPVRTIIRSIGELLFTLGLIVLLLAAYEIYGKQIEINHTKTRLNKQLEKQWAAPPVSAPPGLGDAIAKLYVPKLGLSWVVVEGTTTDDIRYAPGHYDTKSSPYIYSAMPGQVGNFAVAGHRLVGMFWDLDQVKPGDVLVVRDRNNWYVYHVYQQQVVQPDDGWVVYPVPGQSKSQQNANAKPTQALITLTTCNPKGNNYERLVVHGQLASTTPVTSPRPPELGNLKD